MLVEEDSEIIQSDLTNLNNNNLADSISFSVLINEDTSTYMGVKSIDEEQSTIINDIEDKRNNKKKAINKKNIDIKEKREESSSISEIISHELSNERENILEDSSKQKENEEEKEKEKSNEENIEIKENEEEVETKFEWDGCGKIVYVTGSFCDWKKFYIMTKNNEGIFSLTLSLPRGFHQYKFKVDEDWTYSKDQPTIEDNGNINNFIDTTKSNNANKKDYLNENDDELENKNVININSNDNSKNNDMQKEKNKIKIKENNKKNEPIKKKKSKGKKELKKLEKSGSSILSVNFLNSQNTYTIYYPLRPEFNKKPLTLPTLYKTCFVLNQNLKPKKLRKFSEIEYVNYNSDESSSTSSEPSSEEFIPFAKFQNLYHIHSNHLHSKIFNNYFSTVITSMTNRYRFKLSTFIYYKPNKQKRKVKRIRQSQSMKMLFKK